MVEVTLFEYIEKIGYPFATGAALFTASISAYMGMFSFFKSHFNRQYEDQKAAAANQHKEHREDIMKISSDNVKASLEQVGAFRDGLKLMEQRMEVEKQHHSATNSVLYEISTKTNKMNTNIEIILERVGKKKSRPKNTKASEK